jgi:cell wall-associated NlpC family hydrolase
VSELELRAAIVAEARSWLGTRWHHEARRKGVGVDCGQLLIAVYSAVGAVPSFDTEHYPADWHLHRGEQRFLELLLQYAEPVVDEAKPGDIAMFNFARADAHGAIVVAWPEIIHAYAITKCVTLDDAMRNAELADRFAGIYRLKAFAS